ncbi:MAG: hypothetical protein JWO40_398 [Candidatus Doudnabacteria bacterium]|nr:hypothetical protein [Candidatus Doudnabacteria bacterium]
MGEFTKEYPIMKSETDHEKELAEIQTAADLAGGVTPQILEKIIVYMRSRLDGDIFPLGSLEKGLVTLEDCKKAPLPGYPGMFLYTYGNEVVGVYMEDPKIAQ